MLQHNTATTTEPATNRPFLVSRRRDRYARTATHVIAVEPVTEALRAATPGLSASARYVAAIRTADGVLAEVLAVTASDLAAVPGLREYARQAAPTWHAVYYETGVDCEYCGRLCPPDVAYDHARYLRGNESWWVS